MGQLPQIRMRREEEEKPKEKEEEPEEKEEEPERKRGARIMSRDTQRAGPPRRILGRGRGPEILFFTEKD